MSVTSMPLDYTHLKVDQTVLHFGNDNNGNNNNFLLVSNINIPADRLTQDHLPNVLQRAHNFVLRDYVGIPHSKIHYQVCASYDLRNTATGEIRHWSGSFNPRGNRLNVLSDFQTFSTATFVQSVARACDPNNIFDKLRFFHVQTSWVFDRLNSAIITIQARIGSFHPTIENKGLLHVVNGYHQRVHISFLLA